MNSAAIKSAVTISLCLLISTFEGIDLQAAGLAVPQVKTEFALLAGQLGYFTAASSVGVLIGAIGGGLLSDRVGRRSTLAIAVTVFGLFSIGTALSVDLAMLLATRLLTGIGLGAALPNLVALASENSPLSWKSRAVAIMYTGFPLGGALASAIMSWAANSHLALLWLGQSGSLAGDWRLIFYVGGIAPLVAVPIILMLLPDSRDFQERRNPKPWSEVVFGGGRATKSLLLWVSFFTTLMVLYLLLNWLPALLNSRGFSRDEAFLIQLAFNGGGIPGSIFAGAFMDSSRRQLAIPFVYMGLVLLLAALSSMPTDISIALITSAALGAFVMGTQSILYGLAAASYETEIRGTGVGAAVCAGRIGSVVGPLFAAGLVGAGKTASQVLMAIVPLAVLGGIAAIILTTHLHRTGDGGCKLLTPTR